MTTKLPIALIKNIIKGYLTDSFLMLSFRTPQNIANNIIETSLMAGYIL